MIAVFWSRTRPFALPRKQAMVPAAVRVDPSHRLARHKNVFLLSLSQNSDVGPQRNRRARFSVFRPLLIRLAENATDLGLERDCGWVHNPAFFYLYYIVIQLQR